MPHSAEETERARYTPEKGERICAHIASGRTLSKLLQRDTKREYPTRRQVEMWRKENAEFDVAYKLARQVGAEVIAEGVIDIVDGVTPDTVEEDQTFSSGDVNRDRIKADFRMRLLAKWFSGTYGDKVGVEHNVGATLENLILASMAEPKEPE